VASGDGAEVSGTIAWVPDGAEADVFVGAVERDEGTVVAVAIDAADPAVTLEPARRYDATRALAHVTLDRATATVLDVGEDELRTAWYLAQSLVAAESLGAVETALESSVAYAKERYTFGRAIGSYQAIKHQLTEVLRLLENARSLLYYAGWAYGDKRDEFALAASAVRSASGRALDFASRQMISVHGGIGATWEHDAPLFFRRAQLSRRLLGGTADASDRVAQELLEAADARAAVA
jgi:alkylation response protein AidB-like acyl-CoA dehydrogenase